MKLIPITRKGIGTELREKCDDITEQISNLEAG